MRGSSGSPGPSEPRRFFFFSSRRRHTSYIGGWSSDVCSSDLVYLKKVEHNVERYSKTPVAGIVVLGSTGEAIMLSDEERREVLRTARHSCAPHKVLIAGTGDRKSVV